MLRLSIISALIAALINSVAVAQSNELVNGDFESNPPPNLGNNISYPIAPWVLGPGNQSNVVKVDGPSGFNYGSFGPESDASAPGAGVLQHYLDIANGANNFYQSFTPQCSGEIGFGGSFSTRGNQQGRAQVELRLGVGTAGTIVGQTNQVDLLGGNSRTDPWTSVSLAAPVTAGTTYSFVVQMDNNLNFDNGFVRYRTPCACNPVTGRIDKVPAATLLLPYFEVSLVSADPNTVFSINNHSATAVLAHVTIWSDQAVPVLPFDVALPAKGSQSIDLFDVFVYGNLPPHTPPVAGIFDCTGFPGKVSDFFRLHLQAWLQGNRSIVTDNCAGSKQHDNILRGYITIDTVNRCNFQFPSEWSVYRDYITHQNVLSGDYSIIGVHSCVNDSMVHIESCPTCFKPGDHTFYGRYNGGSAADAREPLPTTMEASFGSSGLFTAGTGFSVWRESNDDDAPYSCTLEGPPSWYPLEDIREIKGDACTTGKIPNAASRIRLSDLLSPFGSGQVLFYLQHPKVTPIYGDTAAQTWVTVLRDNGNGCTVGSQAVQLDCADRPTTLPPLPPKCE